MFQSIVSAGNPAKIIGKMEKYELNSDIASGENNFVNVEYNIRTEVYFEITGRENEMLDIKRFKEIIDSFNIKLMQIQEEITNVRLADDKWSLNEIMGHLIDSASNNHQRFVRLQFGDLLDFPPYDGEKWIKAQKYIDIKWDIIVTLWYNYNCLLLNIIESADEATYGNVWVKGEDAIPFEQLINEYYKHIELHMEHFNKRLEELRG